jgi:hypothetical protein
MYRIKTSSVVNLINAVNTKIADAIAALEVADRKLYSAAMDVIPGSRGSIDTTELWELSIQVRLYARQLSATTKAKPEITWRVLDKIETYENAHPDNSPHFEGAYLAIKLAHRCLNEALELIGQDDGEEVDQAWETAFGARGALREMARMLDCETRAFDADDVLKRIIANTGKAPARRRSIKRRELVAV